MRRTSGLLLLALAVLASFALALAAVPAGAQQAQSQAVTLKSVTPLAWTDEQGNRNPTITVQPGATVTFTIVNDDGGYHNFQVGAQEPSEYLDAKGAQLTYAFTAPQSGSVQYVCPVHPAEMKGTLQVAGSGGASEPGDNGTPGLALAGVVGALAVAALVLARRA